MIQSFIGKDRSLAGICTGSGLSMLGKTAASVDLLLVCSLVNTLVVVAVNSYFQHLISNIDNNWYVCQNASALVSGRTTFLSISSVRRANVALACHDISDVSATSFSIVKMLCTPNTAPIETANIIIASTGDLRKAMRNANDNVRTPIASLGTHFVFALLRTKISSLNFS